MPILLIGQGVSPSRKSAVREHDLSLDNDNVVRLPLDHGAVFLYEPDDKIEVLARNPTVIAILKNRVR